MPIKNWSVVPGNNTSAPPFGAPESTTKIKDFNDLIRQVMADTRYLAASGTVASAATTDLGAVDETLLTASGTATITSFGTVSAGIYKIITFSGACTLTHNATSLILLGSANRTMTAGDCGLYQSLGGGNWKECFFSSIKGAEPTLLTEYTVPAAVATVTFSGLDLNVHKGYRVEIEYSDGAITAHRLSMFVNGLTTETDYHNQYIQGNGVSITGALDNNATILSVDADNRTKAGIEFYGLDGFVMATSVVARGVGPNAKIITHAWSKTTSILNITSLTFTSSVALGIGTGTKFRIYRKDK